MGRRRIDMFDMETLASCGSIVADECGWEYVGVTREDLLRMTKGMPLKAVLPNLIAFKIVYDFYEDE